jgi:plasmid stability protein
LYRSTRPVAGARSAEAAHRAILAAALLSPPRRKLADLLAAMPDVGRDTDFARQPEGGDDADVFS